MCHIKQPHFESNFVKVLSHIADKTFIIRVVETVGTMSKALDSKSTSAKGKRQ